eukprot:201401-Pyramimonas_sp.AAC.1
MRMLRAIIMRMLRAEVWTGGWMLLIRAELWMLGLNNGRVDREQGRTRSGEASCLARVIRSMRDIVHALLAV